jgi:predicted lipoprotein with Yx(FWY)xxD motif
MPIGFMGYVWLAYVSVTDRPRAWTEWAEAAAVRHMTSSLALLAVLVALAALLLAACSDDDSSGSSEPAAGTAEGRQAAETMPAEPGAAAWPPFYAKGRPRAGRGVDADLLGTAARRNGRRQVTYKGQPLYFYVSDPKGQVLCNDIAEFGGTWFALTAAGNPPA